MASGIKLYAKGDEIPTIWKQWFRGDKAHTSRWRREAREAFKFLAGRQWSEEDQAKLREELRPCITFDRSSVIIDAISGNEIQSRQQVQYLPRELGDAMANEVLTEAARWFDQESEAEDEDSEAFVDCIMTGIGVTETRIDFDEDPDGMPAVDRVNCLEFYWDKAAVKQNLKDARRMWRLKGFTADEIKDRGWDPREADCAVWSDADPFGPDRLHSNDPFDRYSQSEEQDFDEENEGRNKIYYVLHLQYWVYEDYYRVIDPITGKMVDMDEGKFQKVNSALGKVGMGLDHVKAKRRCYYQAFIGKHVLEHSKNACENDFTWKVITAKRDRQYNSWYGLYRALKDPQQWANKWLSQILHILNSNSKGGLLYESGVFANQEEAEEAWARPDGMVELRPGSLVAGRVKEKQQAQFPTGFQVLTEFAIHAIRDVTGINLEFLGQREATQPGVLEYQRRQAGMTVLAPLFNSLQRYRRQRGKLMLYYIQTYLSDGRLIRITGDNNQQYIPLVKQADMKYDIIVDDAPTSPNQKEAVWQSFMQILPGVKDVVPPKILLQLLDYSPLPTSVVQKIKEAASAESPEQKQQKMLAARMAIAEVTETEASARLKDAQGQKAIAEAGTAGGGEGGQPLDPSEVLVNQATAEDKMAASRLKEAQRMKTIGDLANNNQKLEIDAAEAVMNTQNTREQTAMDRARLPAEIDDLRASAFQKRQPKPAPRSVN